MEAHNALGAKIVEEAGFKGIWASGLSISAALGVRDNNELSWTQVLDVIEFMSDATEIPILLDGDTGHGNFNNMQRLVKKLEQRDIAGVCIEDKLFPKVNSFLRGSAQPLADIDEFCGKIKAAKDIQSDPQFSVVARVEAFIAGWGLAEALKRAESYRQAGADAILIHSKLSNPSQILAFLKEWDNRHPVVIVPTKYYKTPTHVFEVHKVALIIWANHLLRGSLQRMQEVAQRIYSDRSLHAIEDEVAPLSEVFRLQGDLELQAAEKRYLNQNHQSIKAIVLAATQGEALGILTQKIPKAMIPVGKQSLLEKSVHTLNDFGIQDITVVTGYAPKSIEALRVKTVQNEDFATSGQMVSLEKARDQLKGDCIVLFGDIIYRKYIITQLCDDNSDLVVVVDDTVKSSKARVKKDCVFASLAKSDASYDQMVYLKRMEFTLPNAHHHGEWIGMLKLSSKGSEWVNGFIEKWRHEESFQHMQIPDMLNACVEQGLKISIQYISGHWMDVDDVIDLNQVTHFD